jgi:ribosomal protein L16/L10AE
MLTAVRTGRGMGRLDGWSVTVSRRPALLNLKQCCVDVRAFEIRILASSIEKQLVLDTFMQI